MGIRGSAGSYRRKHSLAGGGGGGAGGWETRGVRQKSECNMHFLYLSERRGGSLTWVDGVSMRDPYSMSVKSA